jgi:putative ABC transport system ATP-binding protein
MVLHVSGVRRSYDTDRDVPVRALRGVSLEVESGEFVTVTGPSGCGKSTLLNIVAGLEIADEGEITVAGEALDGKSETELARFRRHHVGMVFQFYNLLDELSVVENVALAAMLGGRKRKAADARARDLLGLLGLSERATASAAVLSGGQRQRLSIARALANEPTLLLADEPTGALASEGSAEIAELFRRLNDDGQSIVMVTHDPSLASIASRVVKMSDGRMESGARVESATDEDEPSAEVATPSSGVVASP